MVSKTYPGGVPKYIESASKLIEASTKNVNPFDGFKTEVPFSFSLTKDSLRSEPRVQR